MTLESRLNELGKSSARLFMIAKLTVVFFIILCLEAGIALTLLPWMSLGGLGDWGDNGLLTFAATKTGLPVLQTAVASGWFRGAVTGLGILNLFIAFWEMAHFKQSVKMIERKESKEEKTAGGE